MKRIFRIISVEFESIKDFEGGYEYFNVIVTVFDLHKNYLKGLFKKRSAEIMYEKEDLSQVNPQLHEWLRIFNAKSSNEKVTQPDPEVKKNSDRDSLTPDQQRNTCKGTKVDHDFGEAILKQLPRAIKKPVAVIASQTQTSTSLVAILELSHGGKQIISAVRIDGDGMQNGIQIDTNPVTTMHKRGNAITLLTNAIQAEASGTIGVYYLDKNKTTKLLQHQGLQLPNILQKSSDYIHSITDPNSPVKPKLGSVLESRQFLKWFGDWKNTPDKASKVVGKDGSPLVMYHGTNADFNTFDRTR